MRRLSFALLLLCCFYACKNVQQEQVPETSYAGLSPQQALNSFQLPEGLKIELVASEPMISDPVAMEVDEHGNMYVLELHGYPLDTSGTGKIKLLSDTNGDGIPDKSTLFADHLRLPTGLMRWKKGLIVVDVPEVLYLEDSDNDGKADIKKTMLTGIALTNPQHIANTPIFGLDNWIYLAHMGVVTPKVSMMFIDSGNLVRYVDDPKAKTLPRNADGRNIRFKPDSRDLEMLSGESQYGQSFDNWGHHFCVENADHIFHEVIAAKYLGRNPDLLVADASDYISDHGDACEVYPITHNPENQLLTDRGVITSACGITYYNGGLLPDNFNNVTLVAEPVSNIIHADQITERGATFTASAMYKQKEFLASTDGWFRPVQMYIGPDGALYVIDYYRQIIEHPEWLSEEVIKSGALYNGSDKGRIYRITPTSATKMNWLNNINLGKATTTELVNALTSNNTWWRRNAQRLLVDQKDNAAAGMLKQFADTTTSATAIVHALWTLEGLHATDATTLIKALHNPTYGVRENAIKIAELHIGQMPQLTNELLALQDDPSPKVRFQLLCTLGDIHSEASAAAQQKILETDMEDKWVQIAALASAKGNEWNLLQKTLPALTNKQSEGKALFFRNCAQVTGLSQRTGDIKKIISLATHQNAAASDWWQSALLDGLSNALRIKGLPAGDMDSSRFALLNEFTMMTPALVRSSAIDLYSLMGVTPMKKWFETLASAEIIAPDNLQYPAFRNDALKILALNKQTDYSGMFEKIIGGKQPVILQQTAIRIYNQQSPTAAAGCIVKNWPTLSHDARDAALDALLSSAAGMNVLLDAVKTGGIQTTAISWPRKVELMNYDDRNIRERARQLLAPEIESREAVFKQYQPVLTMKGDTAKGHIVFQTVCGTCHQYASKDGNSFGPDLSTLSNRDKASIMADILNPNRSIATQYDLWTVTKTNGEKLSGIMNSSSSAAINLKTQSGQFITIARAEISSMETSETSAMPVGLESSLSKEQMASLLAFITKKE